MSRKTGIKLFSAALLLAGLIGFRALTAKALGPNLIQNPSVETANGSSPASWTSDTWGTNTTTLSYKTTEGHTGSKSLYISTTKYTNGDSKWMAADTAAKPSTNYTYTEFYKSNVATEVDIQYTSTAGKLSYVNLGAVTASSTAWANKTFTFTTPANVKSMTVFHLIEKVGWLQTDDFSLAETNGTSTPPTVTPPTVSLTAPADGSTVGGSQTLSAAASDGVAVAGVQFKVDGVNVGAEDTTSPYSISWDTKTVPDGQHNITATARNTAGLTSTTANVMVIVKNSVVTPTAPTISLTAPAANSTVSGKTVAVSATATDAVSIAGVQFKVDTTNLGSEDTTSPYSTTFDSTLLTNGTHTITATARNASGLTTTTTETVTINNPVVTPPSINFTSPAANATVSGKTVTISAAASDAVKVAGVQFKADGSNNIGAEVTTSPYTVTWDTSALTNGTHTITATARNASNLSTTVSETVTVNNVVITAPTVNITTPANNASVAGTQTITATAADAVSVAGVQFMVDGNNVGTEDTTAPYSASWDSKTVANGSHTITATARNNSGLTTTSTITVSVNNIVATPPTVSISAPVANATVSGKTVTISATASDTIGMAGVQFKVDGTNLGAEDTTAPYSVTWDSTTATNASHTVTAVGRNSSGLTTTVTETVTVNNPVTPPSDPTNLIANPSFETANGTVPANWLSSSWGTNTSTFSYLSTGHTGSRSVEVQTSGYTSGSASWYYTDIPVTAGNTYQYSNWYQSNVDTEVDAEVTMTDGTVQYFWLGDVLANANWTQYKTTFTVPVGAKSMAIYQLLAKNGYIISDDYSLSSYTAVPLNHGLVSVTFDDGWASQYANALPLLQKYNMPATFYIISGELADQPDYMSAAQVKDLYAKGHEIGSHSVTHPDLTTVTSAQLLQEMSQSQSTLQNLLGVPVKDFAYPYGAYNANTIAVGNQYYQSQRSVDQGLNTKDNLDPTKLKIYEVDSDITQAQVKSWIDSAKAQNAWLILVYHEIGASIGGDIYHANTSDLDAELGYLKASGLTPLTVNDALSQVKSQL